MCPHAEKERILGIYSYMPIAEICLLLEGICIRKNNLYLSLLLK